MKLLPVLISLGSFSCTVLALHQPLARRGLEAPGSEGNAVLEKRASVTAHASGNAGVNAGVSPHSTAAHAPDYSAIISSLESQLSMHEHPATAEHPQPTHTTHLTLTLGTTLTSHTNVVGFTRTVVTHVPAPSHTHTPSTSSVVTTMADHTITHVSTSTVTAQVTIDFTKTITRAPPTVTFTMPYSNVPHSSYSHSTSRRLVSGVAAGGGAGASVSAT